MSDSHLGYEYREANNSGSTVPWFSDVNTRGQFQKAAELAIDKEVDAVVHTGDIFDHNPRIDEKVLANGTLNRLQNQNISFYLLVGNHDYMTQAVLDDLAKWDDKGLLTVCSRSGNPISNAIDLYGIHCDDVGLDGPQRGNKLGWDEREQRFGQSETDGPNILCLHESISPPVSRGKADIRLKELLNSSDIGFELVLAGHEHSPPWSGVVDDVPVWYAGPTARISHHFSDADPFVNQVKIYDDDHFDISREYLPRG